MTQPKIIDTWLEQWKGELEECARRMRHATPGDEESYWAKRREKAFQIVHLVTEYKMFCDYRSE